MSGVRGGAGRGGGNFDGSNGLEGLEGLLADAAAAEVARQRAADRMLRQAAAEEATFAGVLVDLAERAAAVVVRTTAGRSHRGVVRAVGRDFAAVQDGEGAPVFVRLVAIASVRPAEPSAPAIEPTGDRRPPVEASLAAVLAGIAADRPRVRVGVVGDATPLAAELASVGLDVLVLRGPSTVVPVAAVTEVVVLDR